MKKGTSALVSTRLDARTVPSTLVVVLFLRTKQPHTRASKFQRFFTSAVTNEPVVFDKFIHMELLMDRDESQAPGQLLERRLEPLLLVAIRALERRFLVRGTDARWFQDGVVIILGLPDLRLAHEPRRHIIVVVKMAPPVAPDRGLDFDDGRMLRDGMLRAHGSLALVEACCGAVPILGEGPVALGLRPLVGLPEDGAAGGSFG